MTPFIGQIMLFAGNFPPRGWAFCDGQLLAISSNTALFSLIGTAYGGDGRTSFALPDLRGRAPIHAGQGPGLTRRSWGQRMGGEFNVLSVTQLPPHNHTGSANGTISMQAKNGGGDESNPGGGYPATASTDLYAETPNTTMGPNEFSATVQTNNTGGGQSINNMQPSLVVHYCIALEGIFPSRS
ncbi:MAG: tail fiber protein [Bacteroidota bacterium]